MWNSHSNEFTASSHSHSNGTPDTSMIDNHAADHDNAGDLRNWEYLTRMYDHDDLFEERAKSYELVPLETAARSNAKLPPSTASSANQMPSMPWSSAAYVALSTHSNEHTPVAENFVARVVINTATNAVYLPRQDVSYHSQGQQQFNAVLGSCSISSNQVRFQHQPLHWPSQEQDCSTGTSTSTHSTSCGMEHMHPATVDTDMQAQINDFARLEPMPVSLPMHSLANQLSYNTSGTVRWQQQQINLEPATANPTTETSIQLRDDMFKKPNAQSLRAEPNVVDREVTLGRQSDLGSRSTTPSTDDSAVSGSAQSSTATESDATLKRKRGDCIEKMCLPLSAYNYFYRDESENIVSGMTSADGPLPDPISDFTAERQEKLLHQHWYVDPFKKKRKHRKKHGRIDFSTLAHAITERWKHLTAEGRAFYRAVAEADQAQYDSFRSPLARQRRAALSDKRIDPATSKHDGVQV